MSDSISLLPGDVLRVERRQLVDGVVSTSLAEGRFAGVEHVGTSELIALRGENGEIRFIPLASVSEITLVQAEPRVAAGGAGDDAPRAPAWDPGVA